MEELNVIIDVSGSMYSMGKTSVVGNVLSTLSALEVFDDEGSKFSVTKMQWDGTSKTLESLFEKCRNSNSLLLTDGYALTDNCKSSKVIKAFLEEEKEQFFVVLCGGDSINISALKDFKRVQTVYADNVLYAVDCFLNSKELGAEQNKTEDDWK